MLKIGEFAALAGISVRMLRHYDDLGLLHAHHVDHESGYRYYVLEQLPRLNRILALKDLGLALEDIRLLLDEALTADEIRGMLKLKQTQLHRLIREEQARLQRVENRLHYIEREGQLPHVEIVVKPQPALHVLSMWGTGWPGYLFREAWAAIKAQGLAAHVRGYLTLYHGSMEFQRTGKRPATPPPVEIAYIVDDDVQENVALPDDRELRVGDIPAYARVASIISNKPDCDRHLDVQMLWGWLPQHRSWLIAPVRELYLKRSANADCYLTEIVFPISRLDEEE